MRQLTSSRAVSSQGGFSLVEVIIALGLLGALMISLSGLFVLGTQQVRSGRYHSIALSAARGIVEEMNGWSFRQTYWAFGTSFDGQATEYTIKTSDPGYADKWQPLLDELNDAHAEIRILSIDDSGGTPPLLANTTAIRLIVTVRWSQGLRDRSVQLVTVRM